MWGAWDGRWANYNGCQAPARQQPAFANSCHRTHVHISLRWAGARGRTSFWTRQVAAEDYGPCRAADLNVGPRYARPKPTGRPRYPPVMAALTKALVPWSGAWLGRASSGPAVTAVQRALTWHRRRPTAHEPPPLSRGSSGRTTCRPRAP